MTRSSKNEFPKSVKLAAWQRSGGICECGCGGKIIAGDGPEYDHRLEVTLGGTPTLENCVVLRKRCHRAKTSERAAPIAKVTAGFEKRINARGRKSALSKRAGMKFDWSKSRYVRDE